MKKTKQKLLIVVMVIVALAIVAVVTLTGHSDPYKTKEYKYSYMPFCKSLLLRFLLAAKGTSGLLSHT